ncbi:MAG TPA: glycosyltransferase [Solirubrobacteraceae bacterium]
MTDTNRPAVSVVVPFAGDAQAAAAALELLRGLQTQPGDELILADNCGTVASRPDPVTVIRADGERSPSHARNVGAAHARREWILFLDADVQAPGDLLTAFFAESIGERVGAITGDIRGIDGARTLAARYGASRNFLGQRSHVRNQFRPRAASANLLVRRVAFEQAGGYVEGIRAAEDTDFTWRLQDLGWALDFRPGAVVGHEYRSSLRDLRHQWRGYAAGAAWLARRYPGFKPDPGLNRALRLLLKRFGVGTGLAFRADGRTAAGRRRLSPWDRAQFLMVDAILAIEEQIGLRMSNETRR